ncbi:hypothetical protein DBR06_SOUSAS11910032, partial [Sousa chinensis]
WHCGTGGVHVGKFPCIGCWERPMPMIEADLALSLFYVRKLLFHPMLD